MEKNAAWKTWNSGTLQGNEQVAGHYQSNEILEIWVAILDHRKMALKKNLGGIFSSPSLGRQNKA